MANSRKPGPLNPPTGACRIPSRTPGPLGYLDQGDPNYTTLLGDTPGPLGMGDWSDPTLPTNAGQAIPYAIYRDDDGTPLSRGSALPAATRDTPSTQISLELAQEMALKITTYFEGGKSMNYQALAGDFDGQGTSFGLIQWNFGQNTLGPILKKMQASSAASFAGCCGADTDYAALKKALADDDQAGQLKWTRNLQKQNKPAWKSAFLALGAIAEFNRIQRDQAAAQYHPLVVKAIAMLHGISGELMNAVQFRSYAALFDLCVQQNGIGKASEAIKLRVKNEKPATQIDLLKIAVVERGKLASGAYRSDCISRRMGILTAATYESSENDVTKKRANPQYDLIVESGTAEVAGL